MQKNVIVRKITQVGLEIIKHFEQGPHGGFASTPYICAAGYPTIGWGHEIRPGEKFDKPITEEEAEELLRKDLIIAERSVCRLINVPLDDNQYDALVSFTFNLGGGRLQISTLRRLVNNEEHGLVPNEFRKWVYGGGKKLKGLVRRRNVEADLYAGIGG